LKESRSDGGGSLEGTERADARYASCVVVKFQKPVGLEVAGMLLRGGLGRPVDMEWWEVGTDPGEMIRWKTKKEADVIRWGGVRIGTAFPPYSEPIAVVQRYREDEG
jgi:hypothetical protein